MTADTFSWLIDRVGLPLAMLIVALVTVLTAWSRDSFISRRTHEVIVATLRQQHRAIEDELRSRAERGERNAEYWQGAYTDVVGLARETQEVARTVVHAPKRRERPR